MLTSQHRAIISGPEAPPQWQWTWKQRGLCCKTDCHTVGTLGASPYFPGNHRGKAYERIHVDLCL